MSQASEHLDVRVKKKNKKVYELRDRLKPILPWLF